MNNTVAEFKKQGWDPTQAAILAEAQKGIAVDAYQKAKRQPGTRRRLLAARHESTYSIVAARRNPGHVATISVDDGATGMGAG